MSDAIVVDNGTGMYKAGIAGEDAPKAYFPTFVGRAKVPEMMPVKREIYVGTEAYDYRRLLSLSYPVSHG